MKQYIIFKTNSQSFGIEIDRIDKIIEFEEGKKIPESLSYMLGIIEYNGKVLPVIDLSKRLYGTGIVKNAETKIIVTNWKDKLIGLAVEDIFGIKSYEEEYEEPNKEMDISKEYIEGFIKLAEDILIVLDIDMLFVREDEKLLMGEALSNNI